jgi:hypothetical protein
MRKNAFGSKENFRLSVDMNEEEMSWFQLYNVQVRKLKPEIPLRKRFPERKIKLPKFRNVESEVDFYKGKNGNSGEGEESWGLRSEIFLIII